MSKVLALIQARLGSTRLPAKALADIAGKPLIQHVVERVQSMAGLARVVVAVPNRRDASFIKPYVGNASVFSAEELIDEADVLGRFALCAAMYDHCDTILRVTADCPLWDPLLGERVLALYLARYVDYASNIAPGYRDGEDVEVFSAWSLLHAHKHATDPSDREHVTPYIRRHFRIATLQPDEIRSDVKTSVDTPTDLERVRKMVAA